MKKVYCVFGLVRLQRTNQPQFQIRIIRAARFPMLECFLYAVFSEDAVPCREDLFQCRIGLGFRHSHKRGRCFSNSSKIAEDLGAALGNSGEVRISHLDGAETPRRAETQADLCGETLAAAFAILVATRPFPDRSATDTGPGFSCRKPSRRLGHSLPSLRGTAQCMAGAPTCRHRKQARTCLAGFGRSGPGNRSWRSGRALAVCPATRGPQMARPVRSDEHKRSWPRRIAKD